MKLPAILAAGLAVLGCDKERLAPPAQDLAAPVSPVSTDTAAPFPTEWPSMEELGIEETKTGGGEDWTGLDGPAAVRKFVAMVARNRKDIAKGLKELKESRAQCGDPGKDGSVSCEGVGAPADTYGVNATWRKDDPSLFEVSVNISDKVGCELLGPHRVVRTWATAHVRKRHCTITGGPLAGMEASLTNFGPWMIVMVTTKAYLALDQSMASMFFWQAKGRPEVAW